MFSRTTSLLQKLTFLVLLGILACLIVIIAQNRRSSQTAEVQAGEDVAVPEAPAEAEPVVTEMPVRPPGAGSSDQGYKPRCLQRANKTGSVKNHCGCRASSRD